jgi:fructoselysine 6-kinase
MIVGIGDNCVDHYLSPINRECIGGNVVNVTVNLKKRNLPTTYIGTVGNDQRGKLILSSLQSFGINTNYVSMMDGPTGITEIEVVDGEYVIKREDYGVSNIITISDETKEYLKNNATIIHLSLTGRATDLASVLYPLNIPLSCDISAQYELHDDEYWKKLFPYLNYVFVSGGSSVSEERIQSVMREISSYGPATIIVTRGAKGCMAYSHGKIVRKSSILKPSEVVDPLGAGDAFISGFLSSASNPLNNIEDHITQASNWAAEACKHYGAW